MRLWLTRGWSTTGYSIPGTEEDDGGVKKKDASRDGEEVKQEVIPVKIRVEHAPKAGGSLETEEGTFGLVRRLRHEKYLYYRVECCPSRSTVKGERKCKNDY
jgi:hypothetical protein